VPETEVVFFRDEDGESPILGWLDSLPTKVQDKCTVRIERLAELGHEMRRPEADYLSGGIYELRAKHSGINYRMLYFFYGKNRVVVTHGFSKQRPRVPEREINLARRRKSAYEADPETHTYRE
jgi:phage-related protein